MLTQLSHADYKHNKLMMNAVALHCRGSNADQVFGVSSRIHRPGDPSFFSLRLLICRVLIDQILAAAAAAAAVEAAVLAVEVAVDAVDMAR